MLKRAREIILSEADAVSRLAERLDDSFVAAVRAVLDCRGKVIVTGIGKSGLVARKLVATFNSTGTPALYLHPTEGLHGDLGILQQEDLMIVISRSGNTDELERLYPVIERLGIRTIAITGNLKSPLTRRAEISLDASVASEADLDNLAPTSSSTAAVALGDALALVVKEERGFTAEDFSALHPAGTLGKWLTISVRDLMHTGEQLPLVKYSRPVREMLVVMTNKRLGTALIVGEDEELLGIFTDGDLRRLVESKGDFLDVRAGEVMTANPKRIEPEALAAKALRHMEENKITALVIVDSRDRPVGLLHIHDILQSKVV
jgi:arabinose-5-phosphate isomerase